MQSQSHWYLGSRHIPPQNEARQAFNEAIAVFQPSKAELESFNRIKHLQALRDVQSTIESARSKYEHRQQSQKARKWLSRLSSRVCYYGRIFDVLVQHHPEYVSLAWGALKFLFVLVENHEKHITHMAKALVQVADVLPRIELANVLYPTDRMQKVVARLYGHIVRFFIRAECWYRQGKLRHTWEALADPVELHHNDLIDEIEHCANEVNDLANAGSQAEQRDIHLELQSLKEELKNSREDTKRSETMLQEMRGLILTFRSLQESANLDTNQRLTDLQLNQVMDFLSSASSCCPLKVLQYRAFMVARHANRLQNQQIGTNFWTDPKFKSWEAATLPRIILVQGSYLTRLQIQSSTVELVNLLRNQKVPVLWALKPVVKYGLSASSATDILKNLTCQAIRLNISAHTESALALSCTQFRAAETPEQWMDLLARAITPIPLLYIVIDLEAVGATFLRDFSWLAQMSDMVQIYGHQQPKGRLKILLVSCGRITQQEGDEYRDLIVAVRHTTSNPLHRRNVLSHGNHLKGTSSTRGINRGRISARSTCPGAIYGGK